MEENQNALFSSMEIDAIGEIMNISLGSSATSVSGMLDRRVSITTPSVKVIEAADFHFKSYEPAVGVEITYISGLDGTNVMILKESDVKVIVGILLGTDYSTEEFIMDEMCTSAICEVMNQMMGASSTALSQFLNREVNISTPISFPIDNSDDFRRKYYNDSDQLIAVYFNLVIDELVNSEFISLLTVELAKELVNLFGMPEAAAAPVVQQQPEMPATPPPPQQHMPPPQQAPPPQYMPPQQAPPPQQPQYAPQPQYQQPYPQQPQYQQPYPPQQPQYQQPAMYPPQMIDPGYEVRQAPFQTLEETQLGGAQSGNLNLIMSVPLSITVEIGRAKKKVKEILDFTTGTVVELDKQAGSQVDIFVNGRPIAKGDVVVVDDFYGVRITQISSNQEILNLL